MKSQLNFFPDSLFHLTQYGLKNLSHLSLQYITKFYLQNMFPTITFLYTYTQKKHLISIPDQFPRG